MLKKIPTKELFFEVEKSPFRAIIKNTMVQPDRYKILHKDTFFLRIKLVEKNDDIFYIDHLLAYNCAEVLAKSIFPYTNRHIGFTNDLKSKAFIFLGEEKDFRSKLGSSETAHSNQIIDLAMLDNLHSYGFSASIAVQNGYDYPDKAIFYLLVELPIDSQRSGYLTIAKFKFKNKTIKDVLNLPEQKEALCIKGIREFCIPSFRKELKEFVYKYEILLKLVSNSEELTSVALDIFDKNRNIEALKSDKDLLSRTRKFIESASATFSNKDSFRFLINFMARLNFINFGESEISPTALNDVLTEKKAYTNLKRLYEGKNKEQKERSKYIKEQVNVFQQIPT